MSDTWVIVYTMDGSRYYVEPEHWNELQAAYKGWMERSINAVLDLTGRDGAEIRLAASRIGDLCRSTPASRKAAREYEQQEKAESGFSE